MKLFEPKQALQISCIVAIQLFIKLVILILNP